MSLLQSLLDQQNILNPFRGFFSEHPDTQIDWKETPHAHVFIVDLPGMAKEDVKLEVHEGKVLQLTAQRKDDEDMHAEKGEKWHCRERYHGSLLSRKFRLPENAKVDEIKASMCDGVLTITVAKEDMKKNKHKHKAVEIDGEEGHASKGLGRFVCCKA